MKKTSVLLAFGLLFYTQTIIVATSDFTPSTMQFDDDDDDDFMIDTDLNDISLDASKINVHPTRSPLTNAENIQNF